MKLNEPIDARVYNLLDGKQIKFKSKIDDYILFDNVFDFARLKVDLEDNNKKHHSYTLMLPYHLYNELRFHAPR